ncbi:MAG: LysE family transporter [Bacteroidales bacterium]
MGEYLLIGTGFAFAAAVQPGPLQAYLLSATMAHGWRRTLPAAFSPLLSDGPIALLVLLLLRQVPSGFERVMRLAGGALLLYLAVGAFREWRKGEAARTVDNTAAAPRTLLQAAAVNALNPNPYLGWSLVLGPLVLRAWRSRPANIVALLASFYGTMVVMLAVTIVLFGTLRTLGPRVARALLLASAVALVALSAYQMGSGLISGYPPPQ